MRKVMIIFILVFFVLPGPVMSRMIGKVTAKVVDEKGIPVEGAIVKVSFIYAKDRGIGLQTRSEQGVSDKSGLFSATGQGMESVSLSARKDGYYKSGRGYKFKSLSKLLNRWEPWNPTVDIVLKKKRNPVPMYDNHRTSYKVPEFDRPCGFDLEKEDWVAPYGQGVFSDFIITFNSEIRAYSDYDCSFTLEFSNPFDGIQQYYFDENDPSNFKWPFEAPVNGYVMKMIKKKSISLPVHGYESNEKKNVHYLFRVRTQVDKNGNIVAAKYGKLEGEFGFVPKGKITFRYFFNPDGTRNLEEDSKQNLFDKK